MMSLKNNAASNLLKSEVLVYPPTVEKLMSLQVINFAVIFYRIWTIPNYS